MSPRAFERPTTIALPGTEEALEGLHVPIDVDRDTGRGAVIAPPHPLYGGSMDSPVVTEIAHACERTGITSLRFNWRGVGGSGGRPSGDAAIAEEDYRASLEWLEETVAGPVTGCGYSFGAATAVRACAGRPRVRRLLLVAPPPAMLDPAALRDFPGEVGVAVGDRDEFAPLAAVREIVESLPRARLEVLPGCDHFFMTGLAELGKAARALLVAGDASPSR